MANTYYTDGIHEFISFHGFAEAVRIVAKVLEITSDQAKRRVEFAQQHNKNEI